MGKKDALSREDWIKAAYRALSAGGLQAVRVEAIARALKVSKGSFYWHFKDGPALKAAMLEHWQAEATFGVISAVRGRAGSAEEQLYQTLVIVTGDKNAEYGGLPVEAAIRDWARHDVLAAKILKQVDEARLQFLAQLFAAHNGKADLSVQLARILYAGLIGLEPLTVAGIAQLKDDLKVLLRLLL